VRPEKNRLDIVQGKNILYTKRLVISKHFLGEKYQSIKNDKVLNNRWNRLKTTHPYICHTAFF
jgi:hypothetical protein